MQDTLDPELVKALASGQVKAAPLTQLDPEIVAALKGGQIKTDHVELPAYAATALHNHSMPPEQRDPTLGEQFTEGGKALVASGARAVSTVLDPLSQLVDSMLGQSKTPEQRAADLAYTPPHLAPNPDLKRGIGVRVGEMAGNLAPIVLTGGEAAIPILAEQGAVTGYYEAAATGADEETRWKNALAQGGIQAVGAAAGGVAGKLASLPKFFAAVNADSGGALSKSLGDYVIQAAGGGAQAGLVGTAQVTASQAVSEYLLKNEKDRKGLTELLQTGVDEGLVPGFLLGAVMDGVKLAVIKEHIEAQPKAGETKPAGQNAPDGINQVPNFSVGEPTPSPDLQAALQGQAQTAQEAPQSTQPQEAAQPVPVDYPPPYDAAEAAPPEQPQSAAAEPQGVPGGESPKAQSATADAAAPPTDAPDEQFPSASTGIKNRIVDAELEAAGLPPATHGDRLSFQQAHDAAAKIMENDPQAGQKLLASLAGNDRPLTGVEDALLVREKNRLRLEREAAQKTLEQARASGGDVVAAQAKVGELRAQFAATSDIQTRVGTENALGLVMRRLEIKHDFSLAGVEKAVVDARGGEPLTPDLEKQITEVHAKYAESEAKYEKLLAEHKQAAADAELKNATLEAENALLRMKRESKARAPAREVKIAKSKARIEEIFSELAKSRQANVGFDPHQIALISEAALEHIKIGYHEFAGWADEMVKRVGEEVRPHLQAAWDAAQKLNREDLAKGIKDRIAGGEKVTELGRAVDKLTRHFVEQGITELGPMVRAVHEVLQEADPNITLREAHDAVTHYGQFKKLSADEVSANVRRIRGEGREIAKLADIAERKPPKVTGIEYPKAEERQRALSKQVTEGMKRLNIKTTDEATQIKSTLSSMKTRLRNSMADMQHAMDTGVKMEKGVKVKLTDAELEQLKVEHAATKDAFDKIFAEPEAPRVDANEVRLQKLIDEKKTALASGELATRGQKQGPQTEAVSKLREELSVLNAQMVEARKGPRVNADEIRLQDQVDALSEKIAKGDIETKGQKQGPLTENVARLKAQRDLLNKQLAEMRKKANAPTEDEVNLRRVQVAEKAVEKSIAAYDKQIADADLSRKQGTPGPSSQKLEMLKARRVALQAELETLRRVANFSGRIEDRNIAAIKARKAQVENANARAHERLFYAEHDPASALPTPRKAQPALPPELERVKADTESQRQKVAAIAERERIKRLPLVQKIARTVVQLRRTFVLSSPSVVEKLAAAGVLRMGARTAQEAAGRLIPESARARMPHEGGANYEAQAWTRGVIDGAKEAWANLKNKSGPRQLIYGRQEVMPRTPLEYLGSLHQALHQLPVQMELTRQFEKGVAWAKAQGLNVSDPLVLMRIGTDAYEYAQRETLLQDNRLVKAVEQGLSVLERPDKQGKVNPLGVAGAALGRVMLPVTTIPTNAVAEAFTYILGTEVGAPKLVLAYKRGIENLGPVEADAIGRLLKKGIVGKAAMAVAFLTYESLGGFYRGKQRRDEVPAGDARIAGVDIDQHLLHSPFLESMQFAANLRHITHQRTNNSVTDATLASALGLLKEAPYAREMVDVGRLLDSPNIASALGAQAASMFTPQALLWAARAQDVDAQGKPINRKASGFKENLQTAIPGLRESLPAKR